MANRIAIYFVNGITALCGLIFAVGSLMSALDKRGFVAVLLSSDSVMRKTGFAIGWLFIFVCFGAVPLSMSCGVIVAVARGVANRGMHRLLKILSTITLVAGVFFQVINILLYILLSLSLSLSGKDELVLFILLVVGSFVGGLYWCTGIVNRFALKNDVSIVASLVDRQNRDETPASTPPSRKYQQLTCDTCNATHNGSLKHSFLLFRTFTCTSCGAHNTLGLSGQARVTYWVILVLFLLPFVACNAISIVSGNFLLPGILPGILVIGAAWGLIADYQFRKNRPSEIRKKQPATPQSHNEDPKIEAMTYGAILWQRMNEAHRQEVKESANQAGRPVATFVILHNRRVREELPDRLKGVIDEAENRIRRAIEHQQQSQADQSNHPRA